MIKAVAVIILSAFSVGLIAETALAVLTLSQGAVVPLGDAIELVVAWFVVLAIFYTAMLKVAWRHLW
jgi:hypothetical protein